MTRGVPRRFLGLLEDITGGSGAWGDITGKPTEFPPSAHTHAIADVTGLQGELDALGGSGAVTFETVAKNLSASDATLGYSGGDLVTVTYAGGVVKTLAYSDGRLVTVTLSGSTPGGIELVKTLSYTGDDLTGVTYS